MEGNNKITSGEEFKQLFKHIDISDIVNTLNTSVWTPPLPPSDRNVAPSLHFLEFLKRMDKCWIRNREASTQTYIDQVLLDVLWARKDIFRVENRRSKSYPPFGEVWSKSDKYYMLGYAIKDKELTSMLLTIETKCYYGDSQPWQLLAIMSHFQLLRMHSQKKIYTVMGILTDSNTYRFFRLDERHKVWRSRLYSMRTDMQIIFVFIDYMIDACEKMSPTSTPLGSQGKLFNENFYSKYMERFLHLSQQIFDKNALYDGMELLFKELDIVL